MDLEKLYEEDEDFKNWVDRAVYKRHRPKEEILKLKMTRLVGEFYHARKTTGL